MLDADGTMTSGMSNRQAPIAVNRLQRRATYNGAEEKR